MTIPMPPKTFTTVREVETYFQETEEVTNLRFIYYEGEEYLVDYANSSLREQLAEAAEVLAVEPSLTISLTPPNVSIFPQALVFQGDISNELVDSKFYGTTQEGAPITSIMSAEIATRVKDYYLEHRKTLSLTDGRDELVRLLLADYNIMFVIHRTKDNNRFGSTRLGSIIWKSPGGATPS